MADYYYIDLYFDPDEYLFCEVVVDCVTALMDYGCTLKAYRKEIVKHINLYGEMHRFIPALASWAGARVAEIEVSHHPRTQGSSKYGISRTSKVILDLITVKFLLTFSTRPIHVFGFLGILAVLGGLASAVALIWMKIFWDHSRG